MNAAIESYQARVRKAVALIEQALQAGRTPDLAELADAAHLSKFHFHRIYRLLTGETCQQSMTRLKLASAVAGLQRGQSSVTEIALDAGYASSQAFAKALKRAAHSSASALQSEPERLADVIAYLSKPEQADDEARLLSVELVSLDPLTVLALHTQGPYADLNHSYEQLFMAAGGPENVAAILGVPGAGVARLDEAGLAFDCALRLNESLPVAPEGLQIMSTPAGLCLRARHQGSFDLLDDSIDRLYAVALAQDDLRMADRPLLFHYLDDPESVQEAFLRTDIYLPVAAGSDGYS